MREFADLIWLIKGYPGIEKVQINVEPALRMLTVYAEGPDLGVIVSQSPEDMGAGGAAYWWQVNYAVALATWQGTLSLKEMLMKSGAYEPHGG